MATHFSATDESTIFAVDSEYVAGLKTNSAFLTQFGTYDKGGRGGGG